MPKVDTLLTMFSGQIEQDEGDAVIAVPDRELDVGELVAGDSYRVAILAQSNQATETTDIKATGKLQREHVSSETPVAEGEQLEVEIEDTGEQGDGIARVGPGYIVFVPDTTIGDHVTVEITQVRENFAFAAVVEEEPIAG